jgi:hypothetical protein
VDDALYPLTYSMRTRQHRRLGRVAASVVTENCMSGVETVGWVGRSSKLLRLTAIQPCSRAFVERQMTEPQLSMDAFRDSYRRGWPSRLGSCYGGRRRLNSPARQVVGALMTRRRSLCAWLTR